MATVIYIIVHLEVDMTRQKVICVTYKQFSYRRFSSNYPHIDHNKLKIVILHLGAIIRLLEATRVKGVVS